MEKFWAGVISICAVIGLFVLFGCTDPVAAKSALEDMGMKEIKVGGYSWFSCGRDDFHCTKFEAVNPQGRKVNGVVGSGLFFKGATVRFQR